MVFLRKEEADAGLVEQLGTARGALLNVDAQRLKAIRRAALGGGRAVTVLGDLHPAGRRHQRRGRRDIEAVGVVTAGADNFKNIHACIDLYGMVAHGSGTARDLIRGLGLGALGRKRRQKSSVLGRGRLPAHDLIHDRVGLLVGQILLADDFYNSFLDHFSVTPR